MTPTANGTVSVNVPAGGATDTAGNNNRAATALTRTADLTPPSVTLATTAAQTVNAPFAVTATFSESVTGFAASDISITNGTISGLIGSGGNYNFTVTPTANGTVSVKVPASAATDGAGNNNTAATALTRTFSASFSVWSELDTYLKNNGINVSAPVEQVLQNVLNTIKPLTVEIQNPEITATYNATGSVNEVLKALGIPVANGSSILTGSIANPSLKINTSQVSPAYNLSGTINGKPVSFGYQSGQAVSASYQGNFSLSDLLTSMGVSGTQNSSFLKGSISNPNLKIDTSKSPPAYNLSGNISGKPVNFGYQSGKGVTVNYQGDVSLSDLLTSMGVSGTQDSSILKGSIGDPSLKIDTSKSSPAYALSGNISGKTVSFGYQSGKALIVNYQGDISLSDLLTNMGVSGTQDSSILKGFIGNPSLKIDTSKSPPAYALSGNISGKTVSFGYQSGKALTVNYQGDISLSDLLTNMGVSGTQDSSILKGSIGNPSLKIDTSKSSPAYTLSGSINGTTVSFGYQSGQALTVNYQGDVSLLDLLKKVGFDSNGITDVLDISVKNPSLKIDTSKPNIAYTFSGELTEKTSVLQSIKPALNLGTRMMLF